MTDIVEVQEAPEPAASDTQAVPFVTQGQLDELVAALRIAGTTGPENEAPRRTYHRFRVFVSELTPTFGTLQAMSMAALSMLSVGVDMPPGEERNSTLILAIYLESAVNQLLYLGNQCAALDGRSKDLAQRLKAIRGYRKKAGRTGADAGARLAAVEDFFAFLEATGRQCPAGVGDLTKEWLSEGSDAQ